MNTLISSYNVVADELQSAVLDANDALNNHPLNTHPHRLEYLIKQRDAAVNFLNRYPYNNIDQATLSRARWMTKQLKFEVADIYEYPALVRCHHLPKIIIPRFVVGSLLVMILVVFSLLYLIIK